MSLEALREALERRLAGAQAEHRIPSVTAAAFHDGEVLWSRALGLADVEAAEEATVDHAYRIGSITKTFTAVCVLQLREEGLVDLDAPLRAYVPEVPPGPTVRQALAHVSGLQREPPGEIWETLRPPGREELLAGLEDAEQVLRHGERWHYSNLAFGLLGEVVARLRGTTYPDALRRHVLDPLGLERTRLVPGAPAAHGYFVHPWTDGARREPDVEMTDTTAALGQLWSTVGDLARWGTFLADGHEGVLPKKVLDEMSVVQALVDHERWTVGWGLGLGCYRRGERVFVGHGGAMPGFLASLVVHRAERTGAVVLAGSGAGVPIEKLGLDLAERVLDELPRAPEPWRPQAVPEELVPLLGRWWTEGSEVLLTARGGRLHIELIDGPPGRSTSVLAPAGPDSYRCVEGRERGELLRVARDETGAVTRLYFATYPLTRLPSTFGETA